MSDIKINKSWKDRLKDEFLKDYFKDLIAFVRKEYSLKEIYPPGPFIFRALDLTPFDNVKVVIIGQDPYHTTGVANGLAFSANANQRIPPSLLNIFKEIQREFGNPIPNSPDLTRWAEQGVLLLNATLTVEKGKAGSHQNKGWEVFTDSIIKLISDEKENIVFLLWGAFAQKKEVLIDSSKHLVLKSPHPSPFSADRGFFGNNHFKFTNEYLKEHNIEEISW
jgi:uracil-DNA glycosylase